MSFYLYSLTDPSALSSPLLPRGISDAPVETIEHGSICAVVSPLERLPSPVRRVDLERHDAVNRSVLAGGLCLPLRYGTMLPSRAACVAFVDASLSHWSATIERLRGRVELSVRAVLPATTGDMTQAGDRPAIGPGARYLQRRRAIVQSEDRANEQAEILVRELGDSLRELVEAIVVERRGRLVSLAALTRREDFTSAAARVRALAEIRGGRWNISEPWPPYSFVVGQRDATGGSPDSANAVDIRTAR